MAGALAARRGFAQAHAARGIGYSRGGVARAEAAGVCSGDLCRLGGRVYGAGDELAAEPDRIEALAAAAPSRAARQARRLALIWPPALPPRSPNRARSLPSAGTGQLPGNRD